MNQPKNTRPFLAIALAALISLALAACGDSGGDETSDTVAKAQYVKQADTICEKAAAEQETLFKKFSETKPGGSPEELIEFAGLPPVKAQIEGLEGLPSPETQAEQAATYIQALKTGLKQAEADPSGLAEGEAQGPFSAAEAAAQQFGFKVCLGA